MAVARSGGVVDRCSCPGIDRRIVSAAGVRIAGEAIKSAPDDHFTAGPDCGMSFSARGHVGGAGNRPTIRAGIVSPTSIQFPGTVVSTPDDHFTASPHCRVKVS